MQNVGRPFKSETASARYLGYYRATSSRLFFLSMLLSVSASAGTITLQYEPESDLHCPDEATFRGLIAARLGHDPFVLDGASLAIVRLRRVPNSQSLAADVLLENPRGALPRSKTLMGGDCSALAQSAAVTVALTVDPLVKKPDPPPPQPTPAPQPAAPVVETPKEKTPGVPLTGSVSAGASVNWGLAPTAQPVMRAEGRLHLGQWSIGLEGRFGWPVSSPMPVGVLTASSIMGALAPCLTWRWLSGCAEIAAGALRLEGSALTDAGRGTVFQATFGLRALALFPVSKVVRLGGFIEGFVPLTRASALVGQTPVWTVSPVGGGFGLCVSASI